MALLTTNNPFMLGFDSLERMLDRAAKNSESYPPYNIEQIDEKGVVIDGTEYQFGKNLANTDFSAGSAYLFRLDHEGRIAYAEYNMSQNNAYGYMTKSYYDDIAEKGYIKIYTAAGEWQKFELANKVRFNGTSQKTEALYNENVLTPQLIVYTLNSQGLVTKIKTGVSGARGEAMNFASIFAA